MRPWGHPTEEVILIAEHCDNHAEHTRAIGVHDKRLDSHGGQIDDIKETLAALKEIERQNQERIDRMDERIAALEAVPAKRWDSLVGYALTALAGGVAGMAMAQMGLTI